MNDYAWKKYLSNCYHMDGFCVDQFNWTVHLLKDIEWEKYELARTYDGSRGAWGQYLVDREFDTYGKNGSQIWSSFLCALDPKDAGWQRYLAARWYEEKGYTYNKCRNCEWFNVISKTDARGLCGCWDSLVFPNEGCDAFVEGSNVFD